jgi:imidazolonepropionase
MKTLIGPFKQCLTLSGLQDHGAISDENLEVLENIGILYENGIILAIVSWEDLAQCAYDEKILLEPGYILTPGLVDCHTHLCFAGSRAFDYQYRLSGLSYEEMAKRGGGIKYTMSQTRLATEETLLAFMNARLEKHLRRGVTTVELKSGYGLSAAFELSHLRLINRLKSPQKIVPTCLATHVCPPEFQGEPQAYLDSIVKLLLPKVLEEGLAKRVDIFVENSAFPSEMARGYLDICQQMGFDLTLHADQFSNQGAKLAAVLGAKSADHLEVSQKDDLQALQAANVVAVALPGASMGLGCAYAPTRMALDLGLSVAIASDWNPGSAPMGDLLLQASVLGMATRMSSAEIWAGLTFRPAQSLGLDRVGKIEVGYVADMIAFKADHWQEILYQQGQLLPSIVMTQGVIKWF